MRKILFFTAPMPINFLKISNGDLISRWALKAKSTDKPLLNTPKSMEESKKPNTLRELLWAVKVLIIGFGVAVGLFALAAYGFLCFLGSGYHGV